MLLMFRALLFLTVTLPVMVVGVIFTKGSENPYDNDYVEITNAKFREECLAWHNYFRQLHGVPALIHSPELERIARYRAIELAKKDGTNFYHLDDMSFGENLAWNSQEPIDCRIPLQLWYDEWKIYNFQKPHINARNGHFTQMLWKSTQYIGCGQAISKGKNGGTYTVCNYDPAGNWKNEEKENVFPPVSGYSIEWNPLGNKKNIQMPPLTSTITIKKKKKTNVAKKWSELWNEIKNNNNNYNNNNAINTNLISTTPATSNLNQYHTGTSTPASTTATNNEYFYNGGYYYRPNDYGYSTSNTNTNNNNNNNNVNNYQYNWWDFKPTKYPDEQNYNDYYNNVKNSFRKFGSNQNKLNYFYKW